MARISSQLDVSAVTGETAERYDMTNSAALGAKCFDEPAVRPGVAVGFAVVTSLVLWMVVILAVLRAMHWLLH